MADTLLVDEPAQTAAEVVPPQVEDAEAEDVAEVLLVEEVSIDGMCGVY